MLIPDWKLELSTGMDGKIVPDRIARSLFRFVSAIDKINISVLVSTTVESMGK
jgi:hypothetical protein